MSDWEQVIRTLALETVAVMHEPMTVRYGRAIDKRGYLLRESHVLGMRKTQNTSAVELALFAGNPNGSKNNGFYWCMRLFFNQSHQVALAVIFCFYDGTEKSPGFKTLDAAKRYAREEGGFQ